MSYIFSRRGLSLVEGLVVAIIFMIVFSGMAHIYVLCRKKLVVSNRKLKAIYYARETIDRLRSNVEYSNSTVLSVGEHPDPLPSGDLRDNCNGTRTYNVTLGPDDYSTGSGERYKIIKVKVQWKE
ncbi:MAG: hypothetical protein DRP75_02035 [Candidatus Omnitrophota bacterium]|nr:MAG: hypothetical protein DRP75_02035 [Candidatus Omnitrophota bacterium]